MAIEKIHDEQAKAQTAAKASTDASSATDKDIAKAVFVHPLDLSSFDSVKAFCAVVDLLEQSTRLSNIGRGCHRGMGRQRRLLAALLAAGNK
jgi:hypothetical protein